MKKSLLSIILSLVLFAFLCLNILAASPTAYLSSTSTTISANNTITITVNMSNCSSTSIGIIPVFDDNAFELISGNILISGAQISDFSDGCAVIAYTSVNDFDGGVFRFDLKAKTTIKPGDYTIKCKISVEGYSFLDPTINISINEEEVLKLPGDINDDGNVNNKDVVALFRYVSGSSVTVNVAAVDINGDGSINNKDVVALFRYVSGGGTISNKPYHPKT